MWRPAWIPRQKMAQRSHDWPWQLGKSPAIYASAARQALAKRPIYRDSDKRNLSILYIDQQGTAGGELAIMKMKSTIYPGTLRLCFRFKRFGVQYFQLMLVSWLQNTNSKMLPSFRDRVAEIMYLRPCLMAMAIRASFLQLDFRKTGFLTLR